MPAKPRSKAKKRPAAKPRPKRAALAAAGNGATVACWEDDPGDPNLPQPPAPIQVSAPDPAAAPLPFAIGGRAPPPQTYDPGTANFRFYAAACALRRTADFWGAIVPAGTQWEVGGVLPVDLDSGVDLNAFYTRGGFGDAPGLHFFHDTVLGTTFYSGESPD